VRKNKTVHNSEESNNNNIYRLDESYHCDCPVQSTFKEGENHATLCVIHMLSILFCLIIKSTGMDSICSPYDQVIHLPLPPAEHTKQLPSYSILEKQRKYQLPLLCCGISSISALFECVKHIERQGYWSSTSSFNLSAKSINQNPIQFLCEKNLNRYHQNKTVHNLESNNNIYRKFKFRMKRLDEFTTIFILWLSWEK